jgi:hypothetical protein
MSLSCPALIIKKSGYFKGSYYAPPYKNSCHRSCRLPWHCLVFLVLSSRISGCQTTSFRVLPSSTYLFTAGVEVVSFYLMTLRHTPRSVELLWTRDRPVAETSTWQHKHSQETNQTSMPAVGFEPTIPASARPRTYALDREVTGIGLLRSGYLFKNLFNSLFIAAISEVQFRGHSVPHLRVHSLSRI